LIADYASYAVSLYLAYKTRIFFQKILPVVDLEFSLGYFYSVWWIPAIIFTVFLIKGLYTRFIPPAYEAKSIVSGIIYSMMVVFAVVSLGKLSDDVSRLVLLFLMMYMLIFFIILRLKIYRIFDSGIDVLIIAHNKEIFMNILNTFTMEGIKLKSIIVCLKSGEISEAHENISHEQINDHIDRYIIFAEEGYHKNEKNGIKDILSSGLNDYMIIPDDDSFTANSTIFYMFEDRQFFVGYSSGLNSGAKELAKRALDIVYVFFSAPVWLSLLGLSSLAVYLESGKPVFFKQKRVGKNGKTIEVLKLRTMKTDSEQIFADLMKDDEKREEWKKTNKIKNDPRITKTGRFLRRFSLDEIPQFINILKGEMSLVGPRPVTSDELVRFYGDDKTFYHAVRPGLTGLWQVSGRSDTSYKDRVRLDSWYVRNWGLWIDMLIIIKTFGAVFKGRGAY